MADAGTNVNAINTMTNAYTGATINRTTGFEMSAELKTYYNTELLENARKDIIFGQFCKKQPLPANHGRSVEWRKWNTFPQAGKLQEAVIPTGEKFGMTAINANIDQYGLYAAISDQLEMHAIDDVILGCTEEMGASAAETIDGLDRAEMLCGTNVMYCDTLDANGDYSATPTARYGLSASNNRLTPDMVNKAETFLKKQKAPKIRGKYVCIIHPSQAYDLRKSPDWVEAHKYASPEEIFNGEIGELHGCRFIESTEAKVWAGEDLTPTSRSLSLSAYSGSDTTTTCDAGVTTAYKVTVSEAVTDDIVGREVHIYDASATAYVGTVTIVGVTKTSKYLWIDAPLGITVASGDMFYPGEGGDGKTSQCAVYAALFLGADAVGDIDPEGMGLEMIIKSRAEAGGPLNQFSTVGYKFETGAKILYEERILRVEGCSSYSGVDETN